MSHIARCDRAVANTLRGEKPAGYELFAGASRFIPSAAE
jgi:hypothetical protein